MLVVISPAKKLDMTPAKGLGISQPMFAERTQELITTARRQSQKKLRELMGISADLAKLNADRFRDFGTQERKAAVLSFAGDTYQGLEAGTLSDEEMMWANNHLRILSGLYGVLRPLDEIEPYRLEMGSRLRTRRGKSLYDFWGDLPAEALNVQAAEMGTDVLINCASQEYFGAVALGTLKPRVITPVFMEERNGHAKIVSFFAKKARGAMARFIIQNRLTSAESIKDFNAGGYQFQADLSEGDRWVFLRDYPEAAAKGA